MRYDFVKWEANPGFNGNLNSILIGPDRPAYLQLVRKCDDPGSTVIALPIPVESRRRELTGIYVRLAFAGDSFADRPAADPDQPLRVEEPLGIPELREALRVFEGPEKRLWPLIEAAHLVCDDLPNKAASPGKINDSFEASLDSKLHRDGLGRHDGACWPSATWSISRVVALR